MYVVIINVKPFVYVYTVIVESFLNTTRKQMRIGNNNAKIIVRLIDWLSILYF